LLGGAALVALVVLAGSWSALPWSWGFSIYYFCLALGLELARRVRSQPLSAFIPIVVIAIAVNVASWLFHPSASSPRAVAYRLAVMLISMSLGTAAANAPWGLVRNDGAG